MTDEEKRYLVMFDPLRLIELKEGYRPVATWTAHPRTAKTLWDMLKPMRKKLRRFVRDRR